MVVFSKPSEPWPRLDELTCHELAHTFVPSCWQAWLILFSKGFMASLKIYSSLYLISSIFRGDKLSYLKTRFLPEILRSSVFLASNSGLFLFFFCFLRMVCGRVFWQMPFLAAGIASYCALHIEKKAKHSTLASYVWMLATECAYISLKEKKFVKPIPFGEVLILGGALAWLSVLAHSNPSVEQDTAKFVMKLVSSVPGNHRWRYFLSKIPSSSVSECHRQQHAHHSNTISCAGYICDGILRGGGIGLLLDLFMAITRKRSSSSPTSWLSAISSSSAVFFSSFLFIYRATLCLLARLTPSVSPVVRRSLAVFLASFTYGLSEKRSTIPLWLFFKAAQLSCAKISEKFVNPRISKQITAILYSIATGYLLHQGCFEAHNIRPSYWSFLQKLTGTWLGFSLNRRLLCGFFPDADRIVPSLHDGAPNWWPRYDPSVTSLWTGPTATPSFVL